MQCFHSIFVKTWHNYSWSILREQPLHVACILCRVGVLFACVVLCVLPLAPLPLLLSLAVLSGMQCVLMDLHNGRFAVSADRPHPMRELPKALLHMQSRRKKALKEQLLIDAAAVDAEETRNEQALHANVCAPANQTSQDGGALVTV